MAKKSKWMVVLTVADHEQNGFVSLARWIFPDEAAARTFIEAENAAIPEGAEPDHRDPDVAFTFILDLWDGPDYSAGTVDNSRNLPMQSVMRLAPDQVSRWLDERPNPDGEMMLNFMGTLLPTPATHPA